jgi:hypothetical protein
MRISCGIVHELERSKRLEAGDFTQTVEIRDLISELKETCRDKEFSDIVDSQGNQYVDQVMEDGGVSLGWPW